MKINCKVVILLVIFSGVFCEIFHHKESIVKVKTEPGPGGIWQTKVQWKAHWVKHWETRKIWIPMWRKVWGPVEVKEWIPFPMTPPTHSTYTQPPR